MSYSKNKLKLKVAVFLLITTLIFWLIPSNLIFGEGEEQAGGGEVIVDADADANAPAEEGEESQTLKLDVERASPTAASFNVDSGATFSVTFRIENNSTGEGATPKVYRTISGDYSLAYSGLTLTAGPSTSGSFTGLVSTQATPPGSPISYTWTFTAPSVITDTEIEDAITLGASLSSISPHRTWPTGGDKTSDSKSYKVTVLAPASPGDNTAPEGSITINSDAIYTNNTSVTLNLAATDAVGVTQYRVANGIDASGGTVVAVTSTTSFSADISWTLPSGDDTKTVAVQYGDAANNWSSNYMDNIILDQTPPVIVAGTATGTLGSNGWYVSNVTVPFSATDNLSGFAPSGALSTDLASKTTIGEGAALYVTSDGISDMAGNSAVGIQAGPFKVDKTAPVITINIPDAGANYTLNQIVNADWTATDATSGIASATGTVDSGSPINTSSIGPKTFTVDAEDNAGNTASISVSYGVIYQWYGFLPPINTSGARSVFKLGSTVPVKFRIGPGIIPDATATIGYALVTGDTAGPVNEAVSTSAATSGNLFRYDSTDNLYIFNLNTKKITDGAGTYRISVTLDDGMTYNVDIGLK